MVLWFLLAHTIIAVHQMSIWLSVWLFLTHSSSGPDLLHSWESYSMVNDCLMVFCMPSWGVRFFLLAQFLFRLQAHTVPHMYPHLAQSGYTDYYMLSSDTSTSNKILVHYCLAVSGLVDDVSYPGMQQLNSEHVLEWKLRIQHTNSYIMHQGSIKWCWAPAFRFLVTTKVIYDVLLRCLSARSYRHVILLFRFWPPSHV